MAIQKKSLHVPAKSASKNATKPSKTTMLKNAARPARVVNLKGIGKDWLQ